MIDQPEVLSLENFSVVADMLEELAQRVRARTVRKFAVRWDGAGPCLTGRCVMDMESAFAEHVEAAQAEDQDPDQEGTDDGSN